MPVSEDCHNAEGVNYRQRYRNLKRKFRYLIYENECFQDELKKAQRKYLKVNQDKSFLLDRLLQYERFEDSSSDSDMTVSSDSELDSLTIKKKKAATSSTAAAAAANSHGFSGLGNSSNNRGFSSTEPAGPKRKRPAAKSSKAVAAKLVEPEEPAVVPLSQGDGHMTSEEIERHLESRQILLDLLPERAPPTVPTEMFSNDPMGIERYLIDE